MQVKQEKSCVINEIAQEDISKLGIRKSKTEGTKPGTSVFIKQSIMTSGMLEGPDTQSCQIGLDINKELKKVQNAETCVVLVQSRQWKVETYAWILWDRPNRLNMLLPFLTAAGFAG